MSVSVVIAVPLAAPEVCPSCFQLVNRSSSHRSDVVIYFHVCLIDTSVCTHPVAAFFNRGSASGIQQITKPELDNIRGH